ncbi:MAG: hypothetical protein ACRD07_04550 [Acidimicrobiales bacterium]
MVDGVLNVDLELEGVRTIHDEVDTDDAAVVDGRRNGWLRARCVGVVLVKVVVAAAGRVRGPAGRSGWWRLVERDAEDADADVLLGAPREVVEHAGTIGELLDDLVEQVVDDHLLKAVHRLLVGTRCRYGGRRGGDAGRG